MLVFEKKKYVRKVANFKTTDDILSTSIQKSNFEDLELIRDHLPQLPIGERDLTSMTLLLDRKKMPDIKEFIRNFQDRFGNKYETNESTTPYRLTIGLFPLKKPET